MGSTTDQLIAWLDDAYAMESGLVGILQNHAAHFEEVLPTAARRLQRHIVETQRHAERLHECLQVLGAQPSRVKSTLSSVIGTVEGASTAIFRDQLVKDVLADYASEHFEIGCYVALVSAATHLGQERVADLCRENLQEDRAMAGWLLRQIPTVLAQDRSLSAA